jgi:predicted metal-dependent hydrolase
VVKSILIKDQEVKYSLKRSKRAKFIRLHISSEKGLEAVLPLRATLNELERFIKAKESWIQKNIHLLTNRKERYNYLGRRVVVFNQYDLFRKTNSYFYKNGKLIISTPINSKHETLSLFHEWLYDTAKVYLPRRTKQIADSNNFEYSKVRVKRQKTRWGSCSSNGNLNFNFKLLKLRKELIDYVIVHELCHLKEMNHSPRFWSLVEEIIPNYKELRKELRRFSY